MGNLTVFRRLLIVSVTAGLPVAIAWGCINVDVGGGDASTETRSNTFQVGSSTDLDVDIFNGAISVAGAEGDRINVVARLRRPERIEYQAVQENGTVIVKASRTGVSIGDGPSVDVEVSVPPGTRLRLHTSNGRIETRNVRSGGSLRTSNGRISVDGMDGALDAATSNGAIEVTGFSGSIRLETSNGLVSFAGELTEGTENQIQTSNGSVVVTLEDNPSVRIDASTSNGGVTTELPVVATRTGQNQLEGRIGAGAAGLRIRSSNGPITIR